MSSPIPATDSRPSFKLGRDPIRFAFNNTYAQFPERFYARLPPDPVAAPTLIQLNDTLALKLGLEAAALAGPVGARIFSGNQIPNDAEPMALAYAGHQFGYFVPQLGDGRAHLLGEVIATDGQRFDIQLKGSGRTPFSRGGDGRASLGPVLREYIVSEAMAALGVPTTRALAAVTTGEQVIRETILPGAVLTRVASSHLRVGTFQFFAARSDVDGLRLLADYAIARHYPEAAQASHPYRALLDGVIASHARLVAQWMLLGFIHGVMNTDNTSISGETIDYGPCAFMEAYDPDTVFSSIDRQGRYAYGNQPRAASWNLARLAEALLPLLAQEQGSQDAAVASANASMAAFGPQFEAAHLSGLRRKIGLFTEHESDIGLIEDLLSRMSTNSADFTLTFRRLADAAETPEADAAVRALFADPVSYDQWVAAWRVRLSQETLSAPARAEAMRAINPLYIPRNHLVEAALQAATSSQDFVPFRELLEVLADPFHERPGLERFATPARPEESIAHTFCGT